MSYQLESVILIKRNLLEKQKQRERKLKNKILIITNSELAIITLDCQHHLICGHVCHQMEKVLYYCWVQAGHFCSIWSLGNIVRVSVTVCQWTGGRLGQTHYQKAQ